MKNLPKIKTLLLSLGLLAAVSLQAQNTYLYRANLPVPDSNGFYKIRLQPDFIAKSQANYSDIRLMDAQSTFQPYLYYSNMFDTAPPAFKELPAIKNSIPSSITVENAAGISINKLSLFLRNAAVNRTVNVLGSDDNTTWFAIKENVSIPPATDNSNNVYEQTISFPSSNYRYLQFQLNENKKAPINILKAGIYTPTAPIPDYDTLPVSGITQRDSANVSIVTIQLPDAYQVNKIHLTITGAPFFQRLVTVYELIHHQEVFVSESILSSKEAPALTVTAKTSRLILHIRNEDSPPLNIASVKAYQQTVSLLTYLEKGKHYQLLTGNIAASRPVYDLRFFYQDAASRQPGLLNHEAVTANSTSPQVAPAKDKGLPSWVLWLIIGVAVTALTVLSMKMVKEVSKNKQ